MPKTVCIVTDKAFVSGGQAKVAIDTAVLLADRGLRVVFFAAVGPVDPALGHPGIEVVCLGQDDILRNANRLAAMVSGLWNRKAAQALDDLIGRLDPATTVIHCHGFAKALSPAIGPVLSRSPVPVLFTMHEYFLACPNGGFFDYPANEICERRPLGPSCLTRNCDARHAAHKVWRVGRQALTWGPGRLPKGLRHIAYLSDTQLEAMRPYLPSRADLHHLPNPVTVTTRDLADPRSSRDFIFVGRLSPEKGGRIFAEAAAEADVRCVFVGDGPERSEIERLNPDAVVTGWKSHDEVQRVMRGARALVFPSLWYETFGLVAYEAIAQGLPVIAGRRNAASEALENGRNGVILDRMDVSSLAHALRALKDDTHAVFDGILQPASRSVPTPETYADRLLTIFDRMVA